MKIKNIIYSIVSVFIAASLSKYLNDLGMNDWFLSLKKPLIHPPGYVFAVVWNILYLLLARSFYLVLESKENKIKAINYYIANLILQVVWCGAFFAMNSMVSGVIVFFVLVPSAIKMTLEFKEINSSTYIMLIPYVLWLCFATLLNISFLFVN